MPVLQGTQGNQVFLVTRIREAHVHGADFRESVVDGFRNTARVVSAAALIMISVFAAFRLSDEPVLKSMGFALVPAQVRRLTVAGAGRSLAAVQAIAPAKELP